jgi:hypothetical protein
MRKTFAFAAFCGALALSTAAFAEKPASTPPTTNLGKGDGSNASACGSTHGAFADVNGNFGFLGGLGGTPGYHGATGQEPSATGYNNSHTDCQPNNPS